MQQVEAAAQQTRPRIVIMETFADDYIAELAPRFPELEFCAATDVRAALPLMPQANALFALAPWVTDELVRDAHQLQWIQALTSGVDTLAKLPSLSPDVVITSTRGIHGPQVAEMAILQMLALSRDLPSIIVNQQRRSWERWPQRLLWKRTVTIVGVGIIGEALAKRCHAFDMRVLGVSATERDVPFFDRIYPRSAIHDALGQSDFVVLLLPFTANTHHMIGAAELKAMRPEACLINLARGGIVDEAALLSSLRAGEIAAAAFDVFENEPLPGDSPLWNEPRLLLTPHIAGMSDCYLDQVLPLLNDNIRAFVNGARGDWRNLVTVERQSSPENAK